ncbi:uncharacterized protein CC84DRAFT_1233405 [Paraphaeosphaeria sporulosa]|uniref:Uncharacterized protein n=1 Tax=Paraphaeosphaeria sporulosa TaxID=1460663 RepID=A0A177BVM8_9PLEO|nr:uncharacterized protein CC84DRAFT_1233405 [Paraphaeosphaeria sporulosa]OAF99030.1 hypothetical protein CC84DRAFT_1233405 [Paraphaeosphaeria sporulosa]
MFKGSSKVCRLLQFDHNCELIASADLLLRSMPQTSMLRRFSPSWPYKTIPQLPGTTQDGAFQRLESQMTSSGFDQRSYSFQLLKTSHVPRKSASADPREFDLDSTSLWNPISHRGCYKFCMDHDGFSRIASHSQHVYLIIVAHNAANIRIPLNATFPATPQQTFNGMLHYLSVRHLRQSNVPTRLLDCLLIMMALCIGISSQLMDIRRLLPKNASSVAVDTCFIAGRAAWLCCDLPK